ncbi:MAG: hypothetical protein BGO43_08505 [Gammaproteobacteria bacterium 39-13]|nr:hypothetical protein [Gammaproteobacteria bacterium]OJV94291.1 MAG: hypothetical protein BGO43_08505 [Gammaproteobacteria bacterium 39-13]
MLALEKAHLKQGICLDLSREEFLDYSSIASLIKNTSFLETLLLPKIKNEKVEEILSILNEATIENTTLTNIRFNSFPLEHLSNEAALIYKKIQSRLARNKKRVFAIHGGGYIGLGLMADIISQSPFEYNIVATSSDKFINLLINCNHQFRIQHDASKESQTTCVNNVTMVYSRNHKNIHDLYIQSNIMAICLTEEGLLQSANIIAQGLIARYETDQAGLKIFILMNKPDCADFTRHVVYTAMLEQTNNPEYCEKVLKSIHFLPSMVDRIVNKIDTEILLQQLKSQLRKNYLHSNHAKPLQLFDVKKSINQQVNEIFSSPKKLLKAVKQFGLQINLFNAELSFVLYVPDGVPEVSRFPAIKAVKNLDQYIFLKNKFINGPHAILAWLGGLMGYQTVAAASRDPMILHFIQGMMKHEIAPILRAEYPEIKNSQLEFLKSTFFKHCRNIKDDPIIRVGRDPLRKLIRGGCIMGIIELYQKHKMTMPLLGLKRGIASGILYAVKAIDPSNSEGKILKEIFDKSQDYTDLLCYHGAYGNGNYPGMDKKQDHLLIQGILHQIKLLDKLTNENYQSPLRNRSSGN